MSSISNNRDAVELLAEEFLERYRRGERPRIADYAQAHPGLAESIRALFPTLMALEQAGVARDTENEQSVPAELTHIGEYRILREVGRGGMGVVFEAMQESLGRHVALKLLPPVLCRDNYLERFHREARAAARLHHTNIVPVFGVGMDADMHFYVMQFIDGRGLDSVLREIRRLQQPAAEANSAPPPDDAALSSLARNLLSGSFVADGTEAGTHSRDTPAATADQSLPTAASNAYFRSVARLGHQVADALHYAHSQGVLHRDVKPSNLLLAAGGTVWVADFGLAKADDSEDLTDTGDLVGTLRYMAPERLQGHCDARSDIHGLGITLFELLAFRPAFDASGRLRLLDQVAHGTAPRLRQLVPNLPRDLEMVVGKAMAREPADRYATARELAEDLEAFLADRPVQARRLPVLEILSRWCRRHPAVASLLVTIAVLLLVGAKGGWWLAARLAVQVDTIKQTEAEVTERLRDSRLSQAQAGRASRLPGQRFGSLAALGEAAHIRPSPELRNETIACLPLVDIRTGHEWEADLQTDRLEYSTGVAFDPTLEHYAATGPDGAVTVRSVSDDSVLFKYPGSGERAEFLRFSPDGRYLAARYFNARRTCRVWNWRENKVVFDLPKMQHYPASFDFRPDSSAFVLGDKQELQIIELPTGKILGIVRLDLAPAWLAVAPGGRPLVAVCGMGQGRLRIVDCESGRITFAWDNLPTELVAVAWHPNASLLAASGMDGNLYTFDLNSRAPPTVLRGHLLEARELTFSPDGSMLVSRSWDGTTRFWDPFAGSELLRVRNFSFLQFDREGRRLAYRGYNSKRLGIWELADRSICRVLYGQGKFAQRYAGISFSPDSRVLASSSGDSVCLWDPATGSLLGRLDTGITTDLLFDPAGRYLYTAGKKGALACALTLAQDESGVTWKFAQPLPMMGTLIKGDGFQLSTDAAGTRLAVVVRFGHVVVWPMPGHPGLPVDLRFHPQVSSASVSPDGKYVATGTSRGQGVKVWDTETGRLVTDLPAKESAGVGFTPDGTRLLVMESEGVYRSHRVGGWQPEWERREPDTGFLRSLRAAFHPSGRIMAQAKDRVSVRLVDLETGYELAVLPVPESQNLSAYQFSPNGRYLAAETIQGSVQLWDLWRLRATLRETGLDWNPTEDLVTPERETPTRVEVSGSSTQIH